MHSAAPFANVAPFKAKRQELPSNRLQSVPSGNTSDFHPPRTGPPKRAGGSRTTDNVNSINHIIHIMESVVVLWQMCRDATATRSMDAIRPRGNCGISTRELEHQLWQILCRAASPPTLHRSREREIAWVPSLRLLTRKTVPKLCQNCATNYFSGPPAHPEGRCAEAAKPNQNPTVSPPELVGRATASRITMNACIRSNVPYGRALRRARILTWLPKRPLNVTISGTK
jgi:hypothetical protein